MLFLSFEYLQNNKDDLEDITCKVNKDVMKNIGLGEVSASSRDNDNEAGNSRKKQISKASHDRNVKCKLRPSDKQVYVPFSFIKSYFDVSK